MADPILRPIQRRSPSGISGPELLPINKPEVEKTSFIKKAKGFFEPTEKVRLRDVIREIPRVREKVTKSVFGFARDLQQEIARSGASVGLSLLRKKELDISGEEIENRVAREIFGERPLESIQTRVKKSQLATEAFGKKLQAQESPTLQRIGGFASEKSLALSLVGVVGTIALDFTGAGGGKKAFIKTLSKSKDIKIITNTLRKLKVIDDLIPSVAKKLVNITDEKIIAQTLDKINDLQRTAGKLKKTVKPVEKIVKVAKKERGFITSTRQAIPEIRISGQYIPRSTDDLAIKAKNLIKDNIDEAENLARIGTDDKSVATASELIKHYGKTKQHDKAADLAIVTARKLTGQGRAIQAASILGKMTPEGQLRFAAREIQKFNEGIDKASGLFGLRKKIPDLTGAQAKEITDEMKRIIKLPEGTGKAMAFQKLQDKISDLVPSPLYKKLINLWKAGLLTGVKTSGLNTFSNMWHGTSEIVKDIPAVVVDKAAALFTGKRSLGFTTKGEISGLKEGWRKGIRYMRTGFDERDIAAKLDYKKVNFGNSKIAKALQKYEQTVFHLMGAEDQPFFYGAKARSLYSQAIAQGKNKGLKGAEMKKFLDDIVKAPTDEMLRLAVNDAEIAVFQNRTLLGKAAKAVQNIPGGEIAVPFGRTPAAVANQLINYSPIGIVKTIALNIGKGRFDQRAFSQGIGRAVTGTAAMYIGTKLFDNDLISLNFPETERERKLWELEGRKENSFKTPDGKWRSVAVLGPLGFVMVMGGYYERAMQESGSHAEALTQSVLGGAKSLTEQTFLQGIEQFTSAINDPERYGLNTISRLFASGIPTIISDVAKTIDPLERRAKAKEEGFFAPAVARIPFARQTLEPRADVLGRPLERAGNALETMIDPTRPSRIKSGVVIEELRRLFDAGMPATPTEFAKNKAFTQTLTPEQRTNLIERAGSILEGKLTNLIDAPEYKKLPDDEKMKLIKKFTSKSREVAMAETINEIVIDLSSEEQSTRLSELKESGFMTRSVFNIWNELFRSQPLQKPVKQTTPKEKRGPFGTLLDVFKGLTIDPANVARAIFTKEKLGKVEGKLVQLQRDFGEPFLNEDGSLNPKGVSFLREELAREFGIPESELPDLRREHIVPVSAGGSNADSNLQLIPTELHKSYTALDTAVGRAVSAGTLSRREATKLMRALKVDNTMTIEEVFEAIK